jgi:beta-N-acetylhexosaminidase
MTCHVVFPKVDATHSATTSKIFLNDILRGELGFRGAAIADALGMQAIAASISSEATVRDALEAGLDLFLMAGDNVSLEDALKLERIIAGVHAGGSVPAAAFESSRRRVEAVLAKCARFEVAPLPKRTLLAHATLAKELEARKDWAAFNLELPGFE